MKSSSSRFLILFPLSIIFVLANCQAKMINDRNKVRLHTVDEFSHVKETLNSHAGAEMYSVLEPMFDYMQIIPHEFLTMPIPDKVTEQQQAVYPRIKKMVDGRYIMFYQGGRIASRILYTFSDDLKEWTEPKLLWEPYRKTNALGDDIRRFTTADAVVLPNGEIIVVCSYRAHSGYRYGEDCGIMLKRSLDNGQTWSSEDVIYEGTNWEPYLLYLPDGSIHCYFTDCIPSLRDSGTSIIVSRDGGKTWGEYKKVSRLYKYEDRGHKIFTDQMPSVRLLNDGRTLFGFFEARLEPDFPDPDAKSIFQMSLIYNDGFEWKDLGNNLEGPEDRQTCVLDGAAGYVSVFPSGETLLSCNISGEFSLKLGDVAARKFNGRDWASDWLQPFEERAYWGATELASDHEVIAAIYGSSGLQIGKFFLNHVIKADHESIVVDGDGSEWKADHLFYIGSQSQAQAIIRAAKDDDNLYLLVERKDERFSNKSSIELYLSSTLSLNKYSSIYLQLSNKKLVEATTFSESGKEKKLRGVSAVVKSAVSAKGKNGCVAEISIPLSLLSNTREVYFNAYLKSPGLSDGFTGASKLNPETWMRIELFSQMLQNNS